MRCLPSGEAYAAQKAYKTFDWLAPVLIGLLWVGTFLAFLLLMITVRDWTLESLANISAWGWVWIGLMSFFIGRYFGRWWATVLSGVKELPEEKIVPPYHVLDYGLLTFWFPFLPMVVAFSFVFDPKHPNTYMLALFAFLAYGFVGVLAKGPGAVAHEKMLEEMEKEERCKELLCEKIDKARERDTLYDEMGSQARDYVAGIPKSPLGIYGYLNND